MLAEALFRKKIAIFNCTLFEINIMLKYNWDTFNATAKALPYFPVDPVIAVGSMLAEAHVHVTCTLSEGLKAAPRDRG